MRKISFATLAMMMVGISCGGSTGENPTAAEGANGADDELAITNGGTPRPAMSVRQVNLVSDQEGVAQMTDPNLKNAWGLAFNPSGAAWVSAAETGLSPVYDAKGNLLLTVTIPVPEGVKEDKASPTGQVFNDQSEDFNGDRFVIVTEQGTITGWKPADEMTAQIRVDNSKDGAIYKGVAIGKSQKGEARLFATDFHNNKIDVYDGKYNEVKMRNNSFSDRALPKGYAPFNVMAHDDMLIVTYALQDENAEDDVAGAGNGFVDVYDMNGRLMDRLISRGELNAPWGLAMTTDAKDQSSNLLVGNFGDGHINQYRLSVNDNKKDGKNMDAKFAGPLVDRKRQPISIDGLWAIVYGPDAGGFNSDELYFTAGPNDEEHGLFGKLVSSSSNHDKK